MPDPLTTREIALPTEDATVHCRRRARTIGTMIRYVQLCHFRYDLIWSTAWQLDRGQRLPCRLPYQQPRRAAAADRLLTGCHCDIVCRLHLLYVQCCIQSTNNNNSWHGGNREIEQNAQQQVVNLQDV